MAVEPRKLAIGAAAAVVLLIAAWTLRPSQSPTPAPARSAPVTRAGKASAAAEVPGPVNPVKLGALKTSRDQPGEAARNPFRFQPKVVSPPPRSVQVAMPPSGPMGQAPPPGPPPLPPIPLKLVGLLERANGVKWAVLTDGKSGPMYGKDGDIIDGRYAIVKIGTESIEMTYADGRGRQVIRLTGQ